MQDHVGLPYLSPASQNGEVKPLSAEELDELKAHINSGHLTKSHLCKGCLISEGTRRMHRSVRDVDKATHTLHIDIAGPLTLSDVAHVTRNPPMPGLDSFSVLSK